MVIGLSCKINPEAWKKAPLFDDELKNFFLIEMLLPGFKVSNPVEFEDWSVIWDFFKTKNLGNYSMRTQKWPVWSKKDRPFLCPHTVYYLFPEFLEFQDLIYFRELGFPGISIHYQIWLVDRRSMDIGQPQILRYGQLWVPPILVHKILGRLRMSKIISNKLNFPKVSFCWMGIICDTSTKYTT